MNEKTFIKKSKWLSKHLRHAPEAVGLTLEAGGWVQVDDLLRAANTDHLELSLDELRQIVADNDKQRFAFNEAGTKIRANQGHSVEVDLALEPQTPPPVLYHGTGAQNRAAIESQGLVKGRRHHVHLSRDIETAWRVGSRHGKPFVFTVAAAQMHNEGHQFFCSANGVWLVDFVAPSYLTADE